MHADLIFPAAPVHPDLEAVLFELAFEFFDFTHGFDAAVQSAARQIGASALFNVRFEHPRFQRAAAARTHAHDKVYLLLLDRSGWKVDVVATTPDNQPLIEDIVAWAAQPLARQSSEESQAELKNLLSAACAPAAPRNEPQ